MSIFDTTQFTPHASALVIRRKMQALFRQMENVMSLSRNLVQTHGRIAITDALGDDAESMLSAYNAVKGIVESETNLVIDDLP